MWSYEMDREAAKELIGNSLPRRKNNQVRNGMEGPCRDLCKLLWQELGWKGGIKASYFILSLFLVFRQGLAMQPTVA